jgi:polyhydroxyalkanoate synthesis regulator phasin
MSLTDDDLKAMKRLFNDSLEKRVPKIIDEHVPKIVEKYIDNLKLEVGQFSLETTRRFDDLERRLTGQIESLGAKLSSKIDYLRDDLVETTKMADTNRLEIAKIKRKVGLT